MNSAKVDYIFVQAQEMFPQLEASVIYMILSENDFKMNEALPSLTMLSQTIENTTPSALGSLHEVNHNPSIPNEKTKKKKKRARAKTKAVPTKSNVTAKVTQDAMVSSGHDVSTDATDYCSGYLPYYEGQFLDLEFQPSMNEVKKNQSNSSLSKLQTEDNNAVETTPPANEETNVLEEDRQLKESKMNSELTLLKKKFVMLLSYTAVGCANGKRLIFNASNLLKMGKQPEKAGNLLDSNGQSFCNKKKVAQDKLIRESDCTKLNQHQEKSDMSKLNVIPKVVNNDLISHNSSNSSPVVLNSVFSTHNAEVTTSSLPAAVSLESSLSPNAVSKTMNSLYSFKSVVTSTNQLCVSVATQAASTCTICAVSASLSSTQLSTISTLSTCNQDSLSITAHTSSSTASFSNMQKSLNFEPIGYSSPLFQKRDHEINDSIELVTRISSIQYDALNSTTSSITFDPPPPQRLSSLDNPLPFSMPTYINSSMNSPSHQISSNSSIQPMASYGYVNTNGCIQTFPITNTCAWNNYDFYNQGSYNPNSYYVHHVDSSNHFGNAEHYGSFYHTPPQDFSSNSCNSMQKSQIRHDTSKASNSLWLYVMRGLPGSGKSTLAKKLNNGKGIILSTDDYFNTRHGYSFDPSLLSEAHEWNQNRAKSNMCNKKTPVIIDNTNINTWEMMPYMKMAVKYCYQIKVYEPNTWWKFKASELARRNTHNVPKEKIAIMLERYEKNVTIRSILGEELYEEYKTNCLKVKPPVKDLSSSQKGKDITKATPRGSNLKEAGCDSLGNNLKKFNLEQSQKLSSDLDSIKSSKESVKNNAGANTSTKADSITQVAITQNNSASNLFPCASLTTESNAKPTKGDMPLLNQSVPEKLNFSPEHEKDLPDGKGNGSRNKSKKKVKVLAARFPVQNFSKEISTSNNTWNNFLEIVDNQSSELQDTSLKDDCENIRISCEVETFTDENYFKLVSRLNADRSASTNEKVLCANSSRFQPAVIPKLIKLKKPMYDKSTSIENHQVESNKEGDLETLALLFPDYKREDLEDIYSTCNNQLDWATDVIAESSLFGNADVLDARSSADRVSPPVSLDAYYDDMLEGDSNQSSMASQDIEHSSTSKADANTSGALSLSLSTRFLKQLASIFGDEVDDGVEACKLDIDYDLATAIYNAWKQSKTPREERSTNEISHSSSSTPTALDQLKQRNDQLKRDEELARRIQKEENMKSRTPPSSQKRNRKQLYHSIFSPSDSDTSSVSSGKWSVDRVRRPPGLTQIMKEEKAAAKSVQRQATKFDRMKLADQVKREELHAMYRTIPSALLDDIFAANNHNLEETMFAVNCVFCEDDDLCFKTFTVSNSLEAYFAQSKRRNRPLNQSPSFSALEPSNSSSNRLLTFDQVHSDVYTTYDEIRTEANMHRTQMHECQRKAAIANHRKRGELAYYYAQQAFQHQKLLREANQRAAEVTYRRMNEGRSQNELDLHGLHVDEAIDTLRSVIYQLQNDRSAQSHLSVITGRGLNSSFGVPKIKNAVLEWLKNKHIAYETLNDGCIKVTW